MPRSIECEANIPGPSRAVMAYTTCTLPRSTVIAGGGLRQPAPTSAVSTRTAVLQETPSSERETTMSAELSGRIDHHTAYQSPALSRAARMLVAHWLPTTGRATVPGSL